MRLTQSFLRYKGKVRQLNAFVKKRKKTLENVCTFVKKAYKIIVSLLGENDVIKRKEKKNYEKSREMYEEMHSIYAYTGYGVKCM